MVIKHTLEHGQRPCVKKIRHGYAPSIHSTVMNKFIDQSMDHHYEEIQFKHKQGQWPHMSLMGPWPSTHSTHMDYSIDSVNA